MLCLFSFFFREGRREVGGARVCVCGIEIEIVDFGAGLLTTYYLCGGTWVYLFLFLFLFLFFYRLRKRVARLWVVERV